MCTFGGGGMGGGRDLGAWGGRDGGGGYHLFKKPLETNQSSISTITSCSLRYDNVHWLKIVPV